MEQNHSGVKLNATDLTVVSGWGVKGTGWDRQRSPLALCNHHPAPAALRATGAAPGGALGIVQLQSERQIEPLERKYQNDGAEMPGASPVCT